MGCGTSSETEGDLKKLVVDALRKDAKNARAWFDLGLLLDNPECDSVPDPTGSPNDRVNARDCYMRCISVDADGCGGIAWGGLGALAINDYLTGCPPESGCVVVDTSGTSKTASECLVKALELFEKHNTQTNPKRVNAVYNNLAMSMMPPYNQDPIEFKGTEYDALKCLVTAIETTPEPVNAWSNLCDLVPPGETVAINRKEHSRVDILVEVLKRKPDHAAGWFHLGGTLEPGQAVPLGPGGKPMEAIDCHLRACRLAPSLVDAWCALGAVIPPGQRAEVVEGKRLTNVECLQHALSIHQDHALSWRNLGSLLRVMPPGPEGEPAEVSVPKVPGMVTARDCFVRLVTLEPFNADGWATLGAALEPGESVSVAGREYSEIECYIAGIDADPAAPLAWQNLAVALRQQPPNEDGTPQSVVIRGTRYTAQECFVELLELNPELPGVWAEVGAPLAPGEKVTIAGQTYDEKDLYVRALEISKDCAPAWLNLGAILTQPNVGNVVIKSVGSEPLTAVKCFTHAAESNPGLTHVWQNLAHAVPAGQKVKIAGKGYTKAECAAQLVSMVPKSEPAWRLLAKTLGDGERVQVPGIDKAVDRDVCQKMLAAGFG